MFSPSYWLARRGCGFPGMLRELRIWLVGGRDRKAWFDEAETMIAQFARESSCTVMASGGRRGWLRVIGSEWRETGPTWERRL